MIEPDDELYYYFEGLDESIQLINPSLKQLNFEFEKYSVELFETKFRRFFLLATDEYDGIITRSLPERQVEYKISLSFDNALSKAILINYQEILLKGYVMLLRDFNQYYSWNDENQVNIDLNSLDMDTQEGVNAFGQHMADSVSRGFEIWNILTGKEDKFENANKLLFKLRLFNHGHIRLISLFYIDSRGHFEGTVGLPDSYDLNCCFRLHDSDIDFISKHLVSDLLIPPYLKLAFDSFNESYNIKNEKLRFVLLITALESIYNIKGQDIVHIISRHVALTLSNNNKEEFKKLTKEVKDLYNIRSIIVHGKTEKNDLKKLNAIDSLIFELEDLVRRVLKQLIYLYHFDLAEPTKETLFVYLNAKGFEG